ncbi:putative peptidase S15 [Besnoitia besnoiti]|uniref:Putative peptidase S15 n=1 Tax=Besnoitia besnoiti TaxID=94643 RepID=A0A2A9MM66_BESBE|nr:putative peptidase S15 [Besnoitia besnoiti]PFH37481.1 putative peptidase S15 [Besnoitia besnoiti]
MGFSSSSWSWAGLGCGLLALAVLFPPDPGLRFKPPPFKASTESDGYTVWRRTSDGDAYGRRTVYVESGGEMLHCWLYLPASSIAKAPIYVVAHGFGAVKAVADVRFAEKIQEGGMAVITFDYRTWGYSGGAPRHIVDPDMQLEDFRAVLKHIVDTDGFQGLVDPLDIHIFGTSYAGGHVLVLASQLAQERDSPLFRSLRTVSSVVPLIDGKAQMKKALQQRSFFRTLRYVAAILADLLRQAAGGQLQPIYVQIAGSRGATSLSAMELQGDELKIWSARSTVEIETGTWSNELAARSLFNTSRYRPINHLAHIRTPTLLVEAEFDDTCIPKLTADALEAINSRGRAASSKRPSSDAPQEAGSLAQLYRMPINHFDVYLSPHLENLIGTSMTFAKRHSVHHRGSTTGESVGRGSAAA